MSPDRQSLSSPDIPQDRPWWNSFYDDATQSVLENQSVDDIQCDVQTMIRLACLRPGQSVFDQCCGLGQHAIELSKRGFCVFGLDQSKDYIAAAVQSAGLQRVQVKFVAANANCTPCSCPVDLVVNWHSSFGYQASDCANVAMLQTAHQSLKSNGQMILEFPNMVHLLSNFREEFETILPDGTILIRRSRIEMNDETLRQTWEYRFKDGSVRQHRSLVRIYMPRQIQGLMEQSGFRSVRMFGSCGKPLSSLSPRVIFVASKSNSIETYKEP